MVTLRCNECRTEMETVELTEPLPDGGTIRRKRTRCPECWPKGHTVESPTR